MATATAHLQKPETRRARQLKWSTPRWSRARGLNKLVPTVFGVGPIVRIVGVSTIVGAAICAGVKLAFPLIQLGFAWQALLAIPAMFAYVGIWFLVHLMVPGQATINEKYISHSAVQSGWRVEFSHIESSRLIIFSPDHIRLIIRTDGETRKLAVSSTADLQLLISLLSSTEVLDKRPQFSAARSRVETAQYRSLKDLGVTWPK